MQENKSKYTITSKQELFFGDIEENLVLTVSYIELCPHLSTTVIGFTVKDEGATTRYFGEELHCREGDEMSLFMDGNQIRVLITGVNRFDSVNLTIIPSKEVQTLVREQEGLLDVAAMMKDSQSDIDAASIAISGV